MAAAAALLADPCAARPTPSTTASSTPRSSADDLLQDAVLALANEVTAIHDLRGPFHLDWQNGSSLATAQSAALQSEFAARLSAARGLLTDEAAAPLLRVILRETATQLVIVVRVATSEGEQVRVAQVSRVSFAAQDAAEPAPYLQKQLVWKQREPILDAVEHATTAGSVLLVLGRETLWVYGPPSDQAVLQSVAHIPGAVHASRSLAGRIQFSNEDSTHFVLELPGKTCSGSLAEKIALDCLSGEGRSPHGGKGRSAPSSEDTAKLVAPCDHTAWILSSDAGDWSKPDRLFLHEGRSTVPDRMTVFETAGPVRALASGPEAASSTAVVFNLSTGEYEIHRFVLACRN